MLKIANQEQFLKENKFDHLGSIKDIISNENSEEFKKYSGCVDKGHISKRVIEDSEDGAKYFCPVCLISFDVVV